MHPSQLAERFHMAHLALCDPERLKEALARSGDIHKGDTPTQTARGARRTPSASADTLARDLEAAWAAIRSLKRLMWAILPFASVFAMLATELLPGMPTPPRSCTLPHIRTEAPSE
jgi:hypothetical protein